MNKAPTFSEIVEQFNITSAKIADMGITAEKAATAFQRFAKTFWQTTFQQAIDEKLPDPTTQPEGITIQIPVETLQPKNMVSVANYRMAVFTVRGGQWEFTHFDPDLKTPTT